MDGRATAQKHTPPAPCASLGKRLQQKTGLQNAAGIANQEPLVGISF
jgi:hypothetical protein